MPCVCSQLSFSLSSRKQSKDREKEKSLFLPLSLHAVESCPYHMQSRVYIHLGSVPSVGHQASKEKNWRKLFFLTQDKCSIHRSSSAQALVYFWASSPCFLIPLRRHENLISLSSCFLSSSSEESTFFFCHFFLAFLTFFRTMRGPTPLALFPSLPAAAAALSLLLSLSVVDEKERTGR